MADLSFWEDYRERDRAKNRNSLARVGELRKINALFYDFQLVLKWTNKMNILKYSRTEDSARKGFISD